MSKKPIPKDSPYRHCYNCGEIDWATMSPQCGTCGGNNFSTHTSKQMKPQEPKTKVVPPVWDESGRLKAYGGIFFFMQKLRAWMLLI